MIAAAPEFLALGRNRSAGYIFSDAGYDVWLGNARGNTYSKRHKSLSPNDPRFWEFSVSDSQLKTLILLKLSLKVL